MSMASWRSVGEIDHGQVSGNTDMSSIESFKEAQNDLQRRYEKLRFAFEMVKAEKNQIILMKDRTINELKKMLGAIKSDAEYELEIAAMKGRLTAMEGIIQELENEKTLLNVDKKKQEALFTRLRNGCGELEIRLKNATDMIEEQRSVMSKQGETITDCKRVIEENKHAMEDLQDTQAKLCDKMSVLLSQNAK